MVYLTTSRDVINPRKDKQSYSTAETKFQQNSRRIVKDEGSVFKEVIVRCTPHILNDLLQICRIVIWVNCVLKDILLAVSGVDEFEEPTVCKLIWLIAAELTSS
jgi:hypothetical protein